MIKPVNPIELFSYKLLEMCGYGPECHFFYDDERNFYIATKDVLNYSKNPNEIKKAIVYSDLLEKNENGRKIGFK